MDITINNILIMVICLVHVKQINLKTTSNNVFICKYFQKNYMITGVNIYIYIYIYILILFKLWLMHAANVTWIILIVAVHNIFKCNQFEKHLKLYFEIKNLKFKNLKWLFNFKNTFLLLVFYTMGIIAWHIEYFLPDFH